MIQLTQINKHKNKMKDKNHMTISTDVGKVLDKTAYYFMIASNKEKWNKGWLFGMRRKPVGKRVIRGSNYNKVMLLQVWKCHNQTSLYMR